MSMLELSTEEQALMSHQQLLRRSLRWWPSVQMISAQTITKRNKNLFMSYASAINRTRQIPMLTLERAKPTKNRRCQFARMKTRLVYSGKGLKLYSLRKIDNSSQIKKAKAWTKTEHHQISPPFSALSLEWLRMRRYSCSLCPFRTLILTCTRPCNNSNSTISNCSSNKCFTSRHSCPMVDSSL